MRLHCWGQDNEIMSSIIWPREWGFNMLLFLWCYYFLHSVFLIIVIYIYNYDVLFYYILHTIVIFVLNISAMTFPLVLKTITTKMYQRIEEYVISRMKHSLVYLFNNNNNNNNMIVIFLFCSFAVYLLSLIIVTICFIIINIKFNSLL
jgi:hypothetical protein